ncbi:MAG: phosphopantetheine adenylyltransferase [Pseudomonadales bacterium]
MNERLIAGLLLVVAVIHLLPISGFLGAEKLSSLYGIEINNANLEILMRHRAMLFGILGGFFAYAAFAPAVQPMAFLAAVVSLSSFFFLSFSVGEFNDAIRKVVIADIVASVALFGAIVLYLLKPGG